MIDSPALISPIAVTYMALGELKPDPTNPKRHSARQIQKLAAAFGEFGYLSPILVDENSVIIAGHGRRLAAETLGLEVVPVIVLRGLSKEQKKALRIADNRIAQEGSWDPVLLANDLAELISSDYDIELSGFDTIEIDRLLTPPTIAGTAEQFPEPPTNPTTRLNYTRSIIESAGCFFKEVNLQHDVGQDATVVLVVDGVVRPREVALQIKSGASYVSGRHCRIPASPAHVYYWVGGECIGKASRSCAGGDSPQELRHLTADFPRALQRLRALGCRRLK